MNQHLPHNGTETSAAAARRAEPKADRDAKVIFAAIRVRGVYGATTDEIEMFLEMPHQTASARMNGLAEDGAIVLAGTKRPTRHGRDAYVWVARAFAPAEPVERKRTRLQRIQALAERALSEIDELGEEMAGPRVISRLRKIIAIATKRR